MHGLPSAAQRLAQPTRPGFKASGLIRGPGTGTSDSIPAEVPEGTFIMPADSTRQLGLAAQALGGGVPINVSNGEFQVSPDQVQQIGASVLDILRGVTHTPADEGRHERLNYAEGGVVDYGVPLDEQVIPVNRAIAEAEANAQQREEEAEAQFQAVEENRKPPVGFADGGMVSDVTRVGNSYSGGNVGGNVTVNGQAPGGTFSQIATAAQTPTPVSTPVPARTALASAPTPPAAGAAAPAAPAAAAAAAPAPMGWAERNAQRNLAVTASSIVPSQERSAAQARLATLPTPGVPAPAAPSAAAVMPQPAPGVPSASQRLGSPSALQGQSVSTYQPRNYADGGVVEDERRNALIAQIPVGGPAVWTGAGQAAAALSAPAPTQVAPLSPPPPAGALTRAASYAAPAPVASPAAQALSAPAFSMEPSQPVSAQSMDAASGLARRGAADVLAAMPTAQQPGVQIPAIRHSDNDWAARKALENAATAASSITKNGSRFDRTRGNNAQSFAYRAALETDNALKGSAPALAQHAMREQGESQRAGLQVAASNASAAAERSGALERTLISERGANSRAGITAMGVAEAARIRAQQDGKAPAGYRYTPSGNMEPIPGGPADLKQNKEGVQQGKDTQDIFSILNEARPLMSKATGSILGTGIDRAVGAFGGTTEGAAATAQLKALQGALISKMPKMSGPQSDKDVQLYREMAGQIGDSTIPTAQRMAAMDTIERLNLKYLPQAADEAALSQVPSGSWFRAPDGSVRRKP